MDPSYNNSFGSQGSGANLGSGSFAANSQSGSTSSIISSGSGDIRLPSSSTPSPRRRGLIIAGIVLIVLAIVAAVAAIVLNMNRNQTTSISSREAFDGYVTFILDDNILKDNRDIDVSKEYNIDENISNEQFLQNAKNKYELFYNASISDNDGFNDEEFLSQPLVWYGFLISTANIDEKMQSSIMFNQYIDGGIDGINQYIDDNYDQSQGSYMQQVNYLEKERAKTYVELWDIYQQKGCIRNNSIDDACIQTIDETELYQIGSRLGSMEDSLIKLRYDAVKNIKKQCLELMSYYENGRNGDNDEAQN
ncbi:hypothetical protein IKG68_01830 [Candidatus Saccharibacteria bacterium]|nr:hypothetical protein [Candidatus Saccharibacteria bacterium]